MVFVIFAHDPDLVRHTHINRNFEEYARWNLNDLVFFSISERVAMTNLAEDGSVIINRQGHDVPTFNEPRRLNLERVLMCLLGVCLNAANVFLQSGPIDKGYH